MTTPDTRIEAQAADWLARRDRALGEGDGHWTAQQQRALDAWLNESTLHRVAFLRLDNTWRRADRLRALHSKDRAPAAPEPAPPGRFAWMARPASRRWMAGATLALAMGALVGVLNRAEEPQQFATELGRRESVTLADGSQLTLNTATRLHAVVNQRERKVWLDQGEAFFDIAHDASRPFVVMAGEQRVTVLGTKFSLHREGDRLQVAVLEGRVQVQPQSDKSNSTATVLTRADAAVADARNLLITKKTPEQLTASLSWMKGKLVFDQMTLAEAALQFNRYSRKKLVVADAAAAQIRIGGIFDADNVEAFARLLHVGFGLDVQPQGEDIRVASPAS